MKIRTLATKIAATTATLFLATAAFATSAQAGESIDRTKNGATGITFAYYASTDQFCIQTPYFGWAKVSFSSARLGHQGTLEGTGVGAWTCQDLKALGFNEDERVTFNLQIEGGFDGTVSSKGYLNV